MKETTPSVLVSMRLDPDLLKRVDHQAEELTRVVRAGLADGSYFGPGRVRRADVLRTVVEIGITHIEEEAHKRRSSQRRKKGGAR